MARTKLSKSQVSTTSFTESTDANGWTISYTAAGKKVWKKSGQITGLSLSAGISWANGTATTMPVGLLNSDLYSGNYILTDGMIVNASSRHIIPHTIFDNSSGTGLNYGIMNTFSGGTWTSGVLLYNYRIEEV